MQKTNNNLKWDLTHIFSIHSEFEKLLNEIENEVEKYANFQNKLKNKQNLLNFFTFSQDFNKKLSKLGAYVQLNHDIDLNNMLYIEDFEKLNLIEDRLSNITAFVMPELASIDNEFYEDILKDKDFFDYRFEIFDILENKKHTLSLKEEQALASTSIYSGVFDDVYDSLTTEMQFEPVFVNNEQKELHEGTYGQFISSLDRKTRKQALSSLYKSYNNVANTFASN